MKCLNYPLFFLYTAYDNDRTGIRSVIENFNGLKELSSREDGAKELIQVYKRYPVLAQMPAKSSNDNLLIRLPYSELLLSDDHFAKQLDDQQAVELGKLFWINI